jgi:aminomethyltransferase
MLIVSLTTANLSGQRTEKSSVLGFLCLFYFFGGVVVYKRTPIFSAYEQEAKLIAFAGWEMPVRFTSIKEEHQAVRTKAGLFDVSHMGELFVYGTGAEDWLQSMLTNDLTRCAVGQAQYTLLCTLQGTTIDDLLVYRLSNESFMLVVNAANIEKDFAWLEQHRPADVQLVNRSEEYFLLALQGPKAEAILQSFLSFDLSTLRPFRFVDNVQLGKTSLLISRTGYTGEDGFELYGPAEQGRELWQQLLAAGKEQGLLPCGLGARDTLRFEAGLPLYGQELSETITPLEAGLSFAVKTEKSTPFIGQEALQQQLKNGIPRRLIGLEMIDRGIPRSHYAVWVGEQQVGEITTGTQSPTLKKSVGFALIGRQYAQVDNVCSVEIRGRRLKAKMVSIPFYRRNQ